MVFLTEPTLECVLALRFKADIISRQRIIDKAARLVNEKGMGYLVEAMSMMLKKHPSACMLFTRQHENVLGEEGYARKLKPLIEELFVHWTVQTTIKETQKLLCRSFHLRRLPRRSSAYS